MYKIPHPRPLSLALLDSLSSLCRLRDISLRPEGVFQGESQERGGKALASPFGRGGTAAAVTERARPCAKFSMLALSVSLSLDSSPKGRAKNAAEKPLAPTLAKKKSITILLCNLKFQKIKISHLTLWQ